MIHSEIKLRGEIRFRRCPGRLYPTQPLPTIRENKGNEIRLHLSAAATMNRRLKCLGKIQRAGLGNIKRAPTVIIEHMDLDEIKSRMQSVLDDAAAHFAHEEALFKEWGHPEAGAHAQKHAQVMQVLHKIMGGFERVRVEYDWIEAGLKIKQALIEHLLTEDMKYRDYCRASGGRF